jgi:hypothetical protein
MPKTKTRYVCSVCGSAQAKWQGKCPDCGEWNTLVETVIQEPAPGRPGTAFLATPSGAPQPLPDIPADGYERIPVAIGELSRVLGGGIVPGSVVLISGDPGIGKCVTGDTRLLDPVSGAYLTITDWVEQERQVVAMDEEILKLAPAPVLAFHQRGVHSIVEVKTSLGRTLRCTPDHPVLTPEGWQPVSRLQPGSRIATPRALPYFGQESLPAATTKLIGYILSDGSAQSAIGVTTQLPEVVNDLEEIAAAFGMRLVCYEKQGSRAR